MSKKNEAIAVISVEYDHYYDHNNVLVRLSDGSVRWVEGLFVNSPVSAQRILDNPKQFLEWYNNHF